MNLEIISTIAFFAAVFLILIKDRKNIEFKYGVSIRRIKKGMKKIDKFVDKHRKVIRIVGNVAVVVAVVASIVAISLLIWFTISLRRAFGVVLPSVGGVKYPKPVVSIPFWYWLVGIFVVIFSHETMHAVFARLEKIKIKSYGFIFFLLLPIGAFVDPDMKKVGKLKLMKKLRIFAAGSFGNFLVALLVLLISFAAIRTGNYLLEGVGVSFESTIPETPAREANMSGTIYQIEDEVVRNIGDLAEILNKKEPGDTLTIVTSRGTFDIKAIEHPEVEGAAFIGISGIKDVYRYRFDSGLVPDEIVNGIFVFYTLLFWLFLLSVGVGLANLLPMKPFDGGYIFEEFFRVVLKDKAGIAINVTSVLIAALLAINLLATNLIKSFV